MTSGRNVTVTDGVVVRVTEYPLWVRVDAAREAEGGDQ